MKKLFTAQKMIIMAVVVLSLAAIAFVFWDPFQTMTPSELPEQWELGTVKSVEVGENEVSFSVAVYINPPDEKVFHLRMDRDKYDKFQFGRGQLIFIKADQETGYRYKYIRDLPWQPPQEEIAPEVEPPEPDQIITG